MKPSEAFMQNREAIARILKAHGLGNVRVPGSAFRGDSDLDFLAGGNSHTWIHLSGPMRRVRRTSDAPGDPASLGVASGRREGSRVIGRNFQGIRGTPRQDADRE